MDAERPAQQLGKDQTQNQDQSHAQQHQHMREARAQVVLDRGARTAGARAQARQPGGIGATRFAQSHHAFAHGLHQALGAGAGAGGFMRHLAHQRGRLPGNHDQHPLARRLDQVQNPQACHEKCAQNVRPRLAVFGQLVHAGHGVGRLTGRDKGDDGKNDQGQGQERVAAKRQKSVFNLIRGRKFESRPGQVPPVHHGGSRFSKASRFCMKLRRFELGRAALRLARRCYMLRRYCPPTSNSARVI